MDREDFLALRRYCLAPIPEIFQAAYYLDCAAQAHLEGRRAMADELIKKADIAAIFEWSEDLWGGASRGVELKRQIERRRDDPNKPIRVGDAEMAPANIPARLKQTVIARDGYVCRYCGIPVIDQRAQSLLRKEYPESLRWGDRNSEKHAAFQALDLDWDHLIPRSLGGANTIENLVVSCSPCNCARGNMTLAEMGLFNPLQFHAQKTSWDGLTRLLTGR